MPHRLITRALEITIAATALVATSAPRAAAQTTVVLNVPGTQVTDTAVRGGAYATTNYGSADNMTTSVGATLDGTGHALVKFDTENTIPAGTTIASAKLTLTLKSAGADATRTIGVYPVKTSFVQTEATWNVRRAGYAWTTLGGDFGTQSTTVAVGNTAGAGVTIDVTALVQAAVKSTSSRYTRIGLADTGAASTGSGRTFYTSRATTVSVRPALTVVYGAATTTPPPPSGSTVALRALQWNTHHGGWGTDGVYSPDRIATWIVKMNPDIISLNEIEINDSWSQGLDQTVVYQNLLQQKTGITWYKAYTNRYGSTSGNGELVLSKYPLVAASGKLLSGGRSATDVTVVVNGRTVNFTSVHLDNQYESNRITEVNETVSWETNFAEDRIIAGDMNAWPDTTEMVTLKQTYVDTWAAAAAAGTAIAWPGNTNGTTHGTSSRIDYIFQSKGTTGMTLASVQVFNTVDANGYYPSDHAPVLAVFNVQ